MAKASFIFTTSDKEYLTGDNGGRRFRPLGPGWSVIWGDREIKNVFPPPQPYVKTATGRRYVCSECGCDLGTCSCFRPLAAHGR